MFKRVEAMVPPSWLAAVQVYPSDFIPALFPVMHIFSSYSKKGTSTIL